MTDRELLEAAATAAGYKLHDGLMEQRALSSPDAVALALSEPGNTWWNPLTDDGDALRLAVALRMTLTMFTTFVRAEVDDMPDVRENDQPDPCAATRRAIVRAAAAMAPTGDCTANGAALHR